MSFEVTGGIDEVSGNGEQYLKFTVNTDGPAGYSLLPKIKVNTVVFFGTVAATVRLGYAGSPEALVIDTTIAPGNIEMAACFFATPVARVLEAAGIVGTVTFIIYYQAIPI